MTTLPPSLRTTQAIGLISASFLSGGLLATSSLLHTALTLLPAPLLLQQWRKTFLLGRVIGPLLALLSSSSFAALSYRLAGTLEQGRAERFAGAAAAVFAIVPYTLLAMGGVNAGLWSQLDESREDDDGGRKVRGLVGRWVGLNAWRGGLPLVGAVLGAWATVG